MNAEIAVAPTSSRASRRRRSDGVVLLQVLAVSVMVFPSDVAIKAAGAAAFPAGIVGVVALFAWLAVTMLGQRHTPFRMTPIHVALLAMWVVSLASYIVMHFRPQLLVDINGGDRWLFQLATWSGVALVATEFLPTLRHVKRVIRALVWGGAFCGFVATLQFWLHIDLSEPLRLLPGFSRTAELGGVGQRESLLRVSGTAIHPIELGVVAAIILPLAIFLLMYDSHRSYISRVVPVALIGVAIPLSVSRSGFLALAVGVGMFVVLLPARQRLTGFVGIGIGVVAMFTLIPGLLGTLQRFTAAGTADPSIAHRTNNYDLVDRLVREHPWLGRGGGTYLVTTTRDILDNQYLKTAIELGLIGLVVLTVGYFGIPIVTAFNTRRRAASPEQRALCGALAGSALAAAVCSVAFDSLAFPMFGCVYALVIGFIGACWILSRDDAASRGPQEAFGPIAMISWRPRADRAP